MTKRTRLAETMANEQADALARRLDNGYFRIYNGTQPASADTAITTQTLLATLRFANPSAPAADDGLIEFTDPAGVLASATGTASWARLFRSDGTTVVMDGSVGLVGDDPNFIVSTTSLSAGQAIIVSGLEHQVYQALAGF